MHCADFWIFIVKQLPKGPSIRRTKPRVPHADGAPRNQESLAPRTPAARTCAADGANDSADGTKNSLIHGLPRPPRVALAEAR